jgi:hypothetical protein
MTFGDKKNYGSTDKVDVNLLKIISAINDEASKLVLKQDMDYPLFSLRSIANCTG